jgi:transcription antitermination factor NusG
MFFKSSRNLVTFLSTACNVSATVLASRFVTVNLHFPDNSAFPPEFNSLREASMQKGFSSHCPVSEGAKLYPAAHHLSIVMNSLVNATTLTHGLVERGSENWYALYTAPRHEKRVADQIDQQGISCFLPLYRSVRRWKDRRKELAMVLFPGYVFVQMPLQIRLRVLQLPGAVRLVTFNGQPAALPEEEIESLRTRLSGSGNVEPHPYLNAGQRVRVRSGPLQGLEGIIVRTKDRCRIVLSIHLIMRSMAVEVDECDVESIA